MISCDFIFGRLQAAHFRHKLAFTTSSPPHFAEEEEFTIVAGGSMVTAFVLISIVDRKVHETVKALQKNPGVTELHIVAGEYDIVAVVRVDSNEKLADIITNVIVNAPGVERTKTLFALESYSSFDLNSIFSEQP